MRDLRQLWFAFFLLSSFLPASLSAEEGEPPLIRIGSKMFTESEVLGEMARHLVRSTGARTEHTPLGGTQLLFKALVAGEIDLYPEYTGTLAEEIFADEKIEGEEAIRRALADRGIQMTGPLGFNNTYVLGMKAAAAGKLRIRSIADLRRHPELRLGFSNEFLDREDGWPNLRIRYQLPHANVTGLQHDLAYRALESGSIDVIDLYSTDAEIEYYNLRSLDDDLGYFPDYRAVFLYRDDLGRRWPKAVDALSRLEGRISDGVMRSLNRRAKIDKVSAVLVAADFLSEQLGLESEVQERTYLQRLGRNTLRHLYLVAVSLSGAIMMAVPLGIVAAKRRAWGQVILGTVGILQTIPSIALLVFMIPLLGIGGPPAIAALFLYSLLPIVRNTYAGLHDIPLALRESAEALGLPAYVRLWKIELPMASRAIMAGIKTSAVINIGTATLGGFIGAGGYGEPIFAGIQRGDHDRVLLEGALPAAVMALLVQGFFELAERKLVSKGLRLRPAE